MTEVRQKMIFRKVAKLVVAAPVAVFLLVGTSGQSTVAQQGYIVTGGVVSQGTFATGSISPDSFASVDAGFTPVGTFTSMPVSSSVPTATYAQPSTTFVQPSAVSQPAYYPTVRSAPVRSTLSTGYRTVSNGLSKVSSGWAQMKAERAASGSVRGHIGGGLGGARYEGVGWSNQSPQAAIENCCYWGTRPTAQIGVSRSSDGCWYACVLYH